MTTTNGNGKSKNGNGNGRAKTATIEQIQPISSEALKGLSPIANSEELEKAVAPVAPEPTPEPEPKPEETVSAEELLRRAKAQSRKPEPEVEPTPEPTPEVEQSGELATTASEQMGGAIATAGQNLVEAQQLAKEILIATGVEQAKEDAETINRAYQAALLAHLSTQTAVNANSIREQLDLLRQHTDTQTGDKVNSTLQNLGINIKPQGEPANPLGEVVKAKQEVKGIQLFPKKK